MDNQRLVKANAVFWMRAIDLSYGRVKDATADEHDRPQDAAFFAFALDCFRRAAEIVGTSNCGRRPMAAGPRPHRV